MSKKYIFNETEIAPLCNGKWNSNSYRDISSLERIKCCLQNCREHIKYCYDNKRDNCDNLVESCKDGCYQISSEGLKVICDCAEQNGCGNYPNYDYDCVLSKRENIQECCQKKCSKNECNDYSTCNDYINFLVQDFKSPLTFKKDEIKISNNINKINQDNYVLEKRILLIIIIFSLFLLLK